MTGLQIAVRIVIWLGRIVALGIGVFGVVTQFIHINNMTGIETGNVVGDIFINVLDGVTTAIVIMASLIVGLGAFYPIDMDEVDSMTAKKETHDA